jgi:hypothetical protein
VEVLEIGTQRFTAALELMIKGQALTFNGVGFVLNRDQVLDVCVDSSKDVEQITKDSASQDFKRAISTFKFLRQNSSEFEQIVKNYEPRFALCNNYETGVVELAKLLDDKIVWNYGNPGPSS